MMSKVILDLGYYSVYGVNLLCRDNEINMTQCHTVTSTISHTNSTKLLKPKQCGHMGHCVSACTV